MKTLAFFSLLFLASSCATYQVISFDQPIVNIYDDVKGSQDQLFIKANEWMIKTFNNSLSVIQYSDKAEGIIMGKYLMFGDIKANAYTSIDTRIFAKIDIRVKENKARLSIEMLDKWNYDPYTVFRYSKEQCIKDIENLNKAFHASLREGDIIF